MRFMLNNSQVLEYPNKVCYKVMSFQWKLANLQRMRKIGMLSTHNALGANRSREKSKKSQQDNSKSGELSSVITKVRREHADNERALRSLESSAAGTRNKAYGKRKAASAGRVCWTVVSSVPPAKPLAFPTRSPPTARCIAGMLNRSAIALYAHGAC